MSRIPAFNVSRNCVIRFCPYVRKNFFTPFSAPCNDVFWRDFYRWSQMGVSLGIYDYFINVNYRPWCQTAKIDLPLQVGRGLNVITHEGDPTSHSIEMLERWCSNRLIWEPWQDPHELRKYYIWRTFGEAAPEVGAFYEKMINHIWTRFAPGQAVEFEDQAWIGATAFDHPADDPKLAKKGLTFMDELDRHVKAACATEVSSPMAAQMVELWARAWTAYFKEAKTNHDALLELRR